MLVKRPKLERDWKGGGNFSPFFFKKRKTKKLDHSKSDYYEIESAIDYDLKLIW